MHSISAIQFTSNLRASALSVFARAFVITFSLVLSFIPFRANAYVQGAQTVTVDGKLTDSAGTSPLLDSSVVIDIKIYNPTASCLLYEEKQTVDTTATEGRFTILVGSATGSPKRVTGAGGDPGNPMVSVFTNNNTIAGSGCSYTPVSGESRVMRVTVAPSTTGTVEVLSPDTTLDQVPMALVAETLQGLDRDHVLAIDSTTTLNQTNLANVFSSTNYPILTSLLAGTNSQYVSSSASGGAKIPSVATAPASPAAGQIWFNSSANSFQYYNGSAVQTIGTSGAGISSITVGSSLTAGGTAGGTLTGPGTIDVVNSGVTAGSYTKVTVNTKGFVTYGSGLTESDLPVIQTPGKVVGDSITSGTIGGSTVFYSSGNVTTTGNISGTNISSNVDSTRALRIFDPANGSANYITITAPTLTSNYSVIFPNLQGAAGTTLMNDGSGHLSWVLGSAGSVTSVGLSLPSIFSVTTPTVTSTGTLTAGLTNQSANLIFAGPASGGAAAPTFRGLAVADLPFGYDASILKTALAPGKIWIGSTAGIASAVTPFGDVALSIAGSGTVTGLQGFALSPSGPTTAGQMLRWSGSAWAPNFVAMTDLRSTITGNNAFQTSCAANQTLTYNSVGDMMSCSNIAIASSQVAWSSTGANLVFAGPSTGGASVPGFRTLTAADLPAGTTSQWNTVASTINYLAGFVGVGTASPQAVLDVYGTGSSSAMLVPRDSTLGRPTGINGMLRYNTTNAQLETYSSGAWAGLATGAAGGGASQWTTAGANIYYGSGNVGIGTVTPGNTLAITNVANSQLRLGYSNTYFWDLGRNSGASGRFGFINNSNGEVVSVLSGGSMGLGAVNAPLSMLDVPGGVAVGASYAGVSAAPSNGLIVQGSVGVGTTSPSGILDVYRPTGSAQNWIRLFGNTGTTPPSTFLNGLLVGYNMSGGGGESNIVYGTVGGSSQSLTFGKWDGSAYAEQMRIGLSGNVGVGTTSPQAILDINGLGTGQSAMLVPRDSTAARPTGINGMLRYNTTNAQLETYSSGAWAGLATGAAGGGSSQWTTSGSNIYFNSTGNVGIGSTSPIQPLDVVGNARVSGNLILANSGAAQLTSWSGQQPVIQSTLTNANGFFGIIPSGSSTQSTLMISAFPTIGSTNNTQITQTNSNSTIYNSSTTGTLSLGTNGTQQMTFITSGNVGVGTASPTTLFQVYNNNSPAPTISAVRSSSGYQATTGYIPSGTLSATNPQWVSGLINASNDYSVSTYDFSTVIQRFTIQANTGNVGVGTTSPQAILDVYGSGTSQSAMLVPRDSTAMRPTGINGMLRYNTTNAQLETYSSGAWAGLATGSSGGGSSQWMTSGSNIYYGSGNVGIGTSSPLAGLAINGAGQASGTIDVAGNLNSSILVSDSGNGVGNGGAIVFGSNAQASKFAAIKGYAVNNAGFSSGDLTFSTRSAANAGNTVMTEAMRISSTGFVGIGTTSPLSNLHVANSVGGNPALFVSRTNDAFNAQIGFRAVALNGSSPLWSAGLDASSADFKIESYDGTALSSPFVIKVGGNIGVGTTSPQAMLDVYGTGTTSAMLVPRASSASRPTGVAGMIRYNTDNAALEMYNGTIWSNLTTAAGGSGSYLPISGGSLTGVVAHPLGSASAPSVNFGDATTGLFSTGTGNISLATAGATRINLDSSGNVIVGNLGGSALAIAVNPGTSPGAMRFTADSTANYIQSGITNTTGSSKDLRFSPYLTAAPYMTIQGTSGYVGIATSAPLAPLHVNGNIAIPTGLASGAFGALRGTTFVPILWKDTVATDLVTLSNGNNNDIAFATGNTQIEKMRIQNSGNVGVGTTSPQAILDVNGSGTSQSAMLVPRDSTSNRPTGINGMLRYNTTNAQLETYSSGAWAGLATGASGGAVSQWTTSGSNIFYNSTGNVGIGTVAPTAPLSIALTSSNTNFVDVQNYAVADGGGSGRVDKISFQGGANFSRGMGIVASETGGGFSTTQSIQFSLNNMSFINSGAYPITFYTNNVERMRLDQNGYLGLGTSPGYLLDLNVSSSTAQRFQTNSGNNGFIGNPYGNFYMSSNLVYNGSDFVFEKTAAGSMIDLTGGDLDFNVALSGTSGAISTQTTAMILKNSGNVGIGTTTPQAILDVNGSGTTQSAMIVPRDSTAARPTGINGMLRYNTTNAQLETYSSGAWAGLAIGSSGGGASQWTTSGSAIYYGSGNVGIGTTSPSTVLSLYKAGTNASLLTIEGDGGNGQRAGVRVRPYSGLNSQSYAGFLGIDNGSSSARAAIMIPNSPTAPTDVTEAVTVLPGSGNVGIGTNSPNQKLTVASGGIQIDSAQSLFLNGADVSNWRIVRGTGITTTSMITGVALNILDSGSSTEGIALGRAGNNSYFETNSTGSFFRGSVGIGTASPATTLDVAGTTGMNASVEGASSYLNSSTAYAIPDATLNIRRVTLTANATITLPTYAPSTVKVWTLTVMVRQDGTGSRTLTFAAPSGDAINWDQAASTPQPQTTAGTVTIYQFTKPSDETTWYASQVWKHN